MNIERWQKLLTNWSKSLIELNNYASMPYYHEELPLEVIRSNWLGYDGATINQIENIEKRLNIKLPISYKEFLITSNGWRKTVPSIKRLWSTEEVTWFKTRNQDWIDNYNQMDFGYTSVSDEEYFIYGSEQNELAIRFEYLSSLVEVGTGDLYMYLLNPNVVFDNNECEAWILSQYGVIRYKSFWELIEAEYATFKTQFQI